MQQLQLDLHKDSCAHAHPLPRLRGRGQTEFATRPYSAPHEHTLGGVLLDQLLAGWLRPRRRTCARGRIAPAGTVGLDGRVAQARGVLAIDNPLDLRAVDPDVLERAVVEPMKLAHRRVALAPQRVGAPPFARRGGDRPGRGTQSAQDGAHKAAQRPGARGFRAANYLLLPALPLLIRQLIGNKGSFIPGAHLRSPSITIFDGGFTPAKPSRKMNNYEYDHLDLRTMDLTDLHIFRSVVQAGGVTRAAEKLNRVQSNVTTRVRQLESELGVELFVREGKKLHLSSEGKLLLDYADRLLDLAEEAREAVHDAEPRGLLRLGTGESTAAMR